MKTYPRIKFLIKQEQDVKNARWFLLASSSWTRQRYFPFELQYILSKEFSQKERQKIVSTFSKNFYKSKKGDIQEGNKAVSHEWKNVEKNYFNLVDKLFSNHPWPKGNYRGYASIFNMYPRNIKQKTFSYPYRKEDARRAARVIAHEMLHFIFFDYINLNYKLNENSKIKHREPRFVWKVSEVFNTIIENSKQYSDIFPHVPGVSKPYPDCVKVYDEALKLWKKNQNTKQLLDRLFKQH